VNPSKFLAGAFVGLFVMLGAAGCATIATSSVVPTASTRSCEDASAECETEDAADSCREFASALTTASAGVVNAFAVVESEPEAFVLQLQEVRDGFENAQGDWSPAVEAAATSFRDDLDSLIADGRDAIGDSEGDAAALSEAASKFQAAATDALADCSGDAGNG